MSILGVLGGMGPLATVDFLRKLVTSTDAEKDFDHIHTLVDSNCRVPDRSSYIIKGEKSPLNALLSSAKRLEEMGSSAIVMPCNTAHYFAGEIKEHLGIPFINMIEKTAESLEKGEVVALLATKGTYRSNIYRDTFSRYEIEVAYPPYHLMLQVDEVIYMVKRGECIDTRRCRELLIEVIHYFRKKGIKKVILGCTELPLLFNDYESDDTQFIDPTKILAHAAILYMGKKIRSLDNFR